MHWPLPLQRSPRAQRIPHPPQVSVPRDFESEQYLFDELNDARVANGLAPLVRDPGLDQIAIEWTDDWVIGEPDLIFKPAKPYTVAAEGVTIVADPGSLSVARGGIIDYDVEGFVFAPGACDPPRIAK